MRGRGEAAAAAQTSPCRGGCLRPRPLLRCAGPGGCHSARSPLAGGPAPAGLGLGWQRGRRVRGGPGGSAPGRRVVPPPRRGSAFPAASGGRGPVAVRGCRCPPGRRGSALSGLAFGPGGPRGGPGERPAVSSSPEAMRFNLGSGRM